MTKKIEGRTGDYPLSKPMSDEEQRSSDRSRRQDISALRRSERKTGGKDFQGYLCTLYE